MPNVLVYSHHDFDKLCESLDMNDSTIHMFNDLAFISIIGTPEVLSKYLHEENTKHLFNTDHDNVLNLDFDDVEKDQTVCGIQAKAITEKQAEKCVEFIENNLGKTFIIHCRAGKSRSQAVSAFITQMYDEYKDCPGNPDNPCLTPNMGVLSALKRILYKRLGYS